MDALRSSQFDTSKCETTRHNTTRHDAPRHITIRHATTRHNKSQKHSNTKMIPMLNFQRSSDTEAIATALRGVNSEISYLALANQAALTVDRLKSLLPSARRSLQRERILFGVITGVGLRRLGEMEKVELSTAAIRKTSRAAKRGVKILDTITNFEQLPPTQQVTASINRTCLHATIRECTVSVRAPTKTVAVTDSMIADNVSRLVKKHQVTE